MEMLAAAVEQGRDLATLEKLMDLQERWERSEARKAFDAAVSAAKAEIKPIVRNATGHNNKRYADLSALAEVIDPILAEHGLHYSWSSRQDERIHITCELAHKAGHRKETTLAGPADKTGNKNDIQAIGSTAKYLMRYTLELSLGLATKEGDDDGRATAADTTPITPEQHRELIAAIDEGSHDIEKLCEYLRVDSLSDLPASRFASAMKTVKAATSTKKKSKEKAA